MTTTALEERVRAALAHRADGLAVTDLPFDPDPPVAIVERPAPSTTGRRRAALLVAAGILVVVGVAVAATRSDDGTSDERSRTGPAAETDPAPRPVDVGGEGALVASRVPAGLQVVTADHVVETTAELDFVQLFGSLDDRGPRVRLTYQAADSDAMGTGPTVRGVPSDAMASKEHPGESSSLTWREGASVVTADHRGLDQAAAIAFLDRLVPTTSAGQAVLTAPEGDDLPLVDEAAGGDVESAVTTVTYGDGTGRSLQVKASDPTGEQSGFARVSTTYLGRVDQEGRIVAYDPTYDELVVLWPDGQRVVATGDGSFGEAALSDIALSIEPTSRAALGDVRSEADARTVDEEQPVVAVEMPVAVDLPEGAAQGDLRVEVFDEAAPYACIAHEGAALVCDQSREVPGVSSIVLGDPRSGGTWYVVSASREGAHLSGGQPGPTVNPVGVPGTRRAEVDGWTIEAVAVPDGTDRVWVGTDQQSTLVVRPTR